VPSRVFQIVRRSNEVCGCARGKATGQLRKNCCYAVLPVRRWRWQATPGHTGCVSSGLICAIARDTNKAGVARVVPTRRTALRAKCATALNRQAMATLQVWGPLLVPPICHPNMVGWVEPLPGCMPWFHLIAPVVSTLRQLSNHPALLVPHPTDPLGVRAAVRPAASAGCCQRHLSLVSPGVGL
jgi:hypothetical protein